MIKLGEKVKDKVTNLRGTVVGVTNYLYGCIWVCVVPKELHNGVPIEGVWLDMQRVEVVEKRKVCNQKPKKEVRRYGAHTSKPSKPSFPKNMGMGA